MIFKKKFNINRNFSFVLLLCVFSIVLSVFVLLSIFRYRGEWCYFDHMGNSTGRLFVINKHKLVVVFLTKINVLLIQLKSK